MYKINLDYQFLFVKFPIIFPLIYAFILYQFPSLETGLIIFAIKIWKIITSSEILKSKLAIWILFSPEDHKMINSLSFSNLRIVSTAAIRKENGVSFVKIFGIVKKE